MMSDDFLREAESRFNAGDTAGAEALCEQILQQQPDCLNALHLLGVVRMRNGRVSEAIPLFETVLRHDDRSVGTLGALAAACMEVGDYPKAEKIICRLTEVGGPPAQSKALLGALFASQNRWSEAARCFEEAIEHAPGLQDLHYQLGKALIESRRPEEAAERLQKALALDPGHADTHCALGVALRNAGRMDEAIAAFRRTVELDNNHLQAYHNLGQTLRNQLKLHEASRCLEHVIKIDPGHAGAYCDLGVVRQDQGRWKEAVLCYESALERDPAYAIARYNLALARLFLGELERGWPSYEIRLDRGVVRHKLRKDVATLDVFERLPRWTGARDEISGKVGIWAEQGIGDQLLCSTLIPDLIHNGIPFVYEVDRRLLDAYRRSFPGHDFVAQSDPPHQALCQADRVVLAGSLPGLFRKTVSDFAGQPQHFLGALPERVGYFRKQLDNRGPGLKVAISWRSSQKDHFGLNKSAELNKLAPLLGIEGVQFVDVQYGDTLSEREELMRRTGVKMLRFDELDHFNDLEGLLALLEACDLVITTSNATAHLAGALGKKTWLLYLADTPPFYYWARDRENRSYWYPSVEIMTAAWLSDWDSLGHYVAEKFRQEYSAQGANADSAVCRRDAGQWLEFSARSRGEGQLLEAVSACHRALELEPGNARAWSELAHVLRWSGKPEPAHAAAARAIELDPTLAHAWFNQGAALAQLGELNESVAAYRRALEIAPGLAEAWSNLGSVLGKMGSVTEEIGAYRRALEANPGLAPVWSNLGEALCRAGEYAEAAAACRRAVELNPGFFAAWNNLGNVLYAEGDSDAAVSAWEKAVRLNPDFADSWSNLAGALQRSGRSVESAAAREKADRILARRAKTGTGH